MKRTFKDIFVTEARFSFVCISRAHSSQNSSHPFDNQKVILWRFKQLRGELGGFQLAENGN